MATFFTDATDDLVAEILIRLPDCRSAIRCATVCKRWSSLLTRSVWFVQSFTRHRHRHGSTHSPPYSFLLQDCEHPQSSLKLVSEPQNVTHSSYSLDFLPDPKLIIRASFDDLLLLSSFHYDNFYICNSLTRNWFLLPPLPKYLQRYPPTGFGLVSKQSYRAVLFYNFYVNKEKTAIDQVMVCIFSSETLDWAKPVWIEVPKNDPDSHNYSLSDQIVTPCKGVLYWNHKSRRGFDGIVEFDPFGGKWRVISSPETIRPENIDSSNSIICLSPSGDRLRILRNTFSINGMGRLKLFLEAWDLLEDNWVLVSSDRHQQGVSLGTSVVHPNSDGGVLFFYEEGNLYRYQMSEKKIEKVIELFPSIGAYRIKIFPILNPSWPTRVQSLRSA